MTTPKELKELTAKGKVEKEKREQIAAAELNQRWRKQLAEKAAKEQEEANKIINGLNPYMKAAASSGENSIRIIEVNSDSLNRLDGVALLLYNHFLKEGFELSIETVDGPNIYEGPDYDYFLKIVW